MMIVSQMGKWYLAGLFQSDDHYSMDIVSHIAGAVMVGFTSKSFAIAAESIAGCWNRVYVLYINWGS